VSGFGDMSANAHMMVSIVIPCYKSERWIEAAIRSAYSQTHSKIEVIVIDDGSKDGSMALLEQLKNSEFPELKILQHEGGVNRGVSTTRRLGVDTASGEFIAFLDADDCFLPNKVERQLSVFKKHPDIMFCHTDVQVVDEQDHPVVQHDHHFDIRPQAPYWFHKESDYLARNGIACSSVLVRRDALQAVPFAGSQLYQFEDWLCWCLLARRGRFIYLDEPLIKYREHAASATGNVARSKLVEHHARLEMQLTLAAKAASLMEAIGALRAAFRSVLALVYHYGRGHQPHGQAISNGRFYRWLAWLYKRKRRGDE